MMPPKVLPFPDWCTWMWDDIWNSFAGTYDSVWKCRPIWIRVQAFGEYYEDGLW